MVWNSMDLRQLRPAGDLKPDAALLPSLSRDRLQFANAVPERGALLDHIACEVGQIEP
jgi:hypothetical protein